jgi:hypothetical protein
MAFVSAGSSDNFSSYNIISERNVFRPLWASNSFNAGADRSRKEELESLRIAESERQKKQKITDEQTQLDNKKKEIEQTYSLTGIIFENGKRQAVIQSKSGPAFFVFKDDTVDNMKVVSVEDSEAVLDYQGKFTVTLKMEN